jgi:hypothetical protein
LISFFKFYAKSIHNKNSFHSYNFLGRLNPLSTYSNV